MPKNSGPTMVRRTMTCDTCGESYTYDSEVDPAMGPLTSADARAWRQAHARVTGDHQRFTATDAAAGEEG